MNQEQEAFSLHSLTGADVEAIMTGLNELPAKVSRGTMNRLESQIIQQVQRAQQQAQAEVPYSTKTETNKKAAQ